MAKPTIAILGLEVVDKSGAPTPVDTQVAQELTQGLRARAKAGTGPYQIAPNSDKELTDEKLLKNCDDEKPTCMAAIGTELSAEFLMYGRIEKQGGSYQVTVTLLDVKRKAKDKTIPQPIPLAESSGAALQVHAKKIYAGLTGQTDACSILVKTSGGVDKGTILVNGEPKGNVTAGSGEVKNLSEGKYTVAVEAKDFRRYENPSVTCTAGQQAVISAEMTKNVETGGGTGSGSGSGSDTGGMGSGSGSGSGEVTGTYTHPTSHKGLWRAVAIGALAGAAVSGGAWIYGFSKSSSFNNSGHVVTGLDAMGNQVFGDKNFDQSHCDATFSNMSGTGFTGKVSDYTANGGFKDACKGYTITKFAIPATVGFAAIAAVGVIMMVRSPDSESAVQVSGSATNKTSGRRTKRPPFAIVPVVGPNGGGATFAMEW